jgi:lipopolysaccharide biosynthesis protein
MNKNNAIILHLYYNDLWFEFKEYLIPIMENCDVDLYVTLTKDDTSAIEDIKQITNNIYILENKGLDIGPFLYVLDKIKNINYITITKIHSKKSLQKISLNGDIWRKNSYQPLLYNTYCYTELSNIIKNNPLYMIGSLSNYYKYSKDMNSLIHKNKLIQQTLFDLKINIKQNHKKLEFFAGTMFMTSHYYLKKLLENCNILDFYEKLENGYIINSKAHAMERIFGYYLIELNGKLIKI